MYLFIILFLFFFESRLLQLLLCLPVLPLRFLPAVRVHSIVVLRPHLVQLELKSFGLKFELLDISLLVPALLGEIGGSHEIFEGDCVILI